MEVGLEGYNFCLIKKLLLCEIIAQKFSFNLSKIIQERGYCARKGIPVSETEQFWRKMLFQVYHSKPEKPMLGFKVKYAFYYPFSWFKHFHCFPAQMFTLFITVKIPNHIRLY